MYSSIGILDLIFHDSPEMIQSNSDYFRPFERTKGQGHSALYNTITNNVFSAGVLRFLRRGYKLSTSSHQPHPARVGLRALRIEHQASR